MNPVVTPFGTTRCGEDVQLLSLDNGTLSCQILTFGATLRTLQVPDRHDRPIDVVLGYDTLTEYEIRDGYLGAVVGRYANRIAKGRFTLGGHEYLLACNNGPHHLHGGLVGFSHRVWKVEELSHCRALLSLESPDGEEGYPGHLKVLAEYRLDGSSLSLTFESLSSQDTPCNLTNHSYFNLSGQGSGPVLDQEITIHAQRYTPADKTSIPTGELALVEGTPMDLRCPTPIGAHIDEPFCQLEWGRGYDHNYVTDGRPESLRPAAEAYSSATGIAMEVETTLPGVQFYTANYLESGRPGKGGTRYGPRHAFCLETQFFPDSPNHPHFPSCILQAGQVRRDQTRFSFKVR